MDTFNRQQPTSTQQSIYRNTEQKKKSPQKLKSYFKWKKKRPSLRRGDKGIHFGSGGGGEEEESADGEARRLARRYVIHFPPALSLSLTHTLCRSLLTMRTTAIFCLVFLYGLGHGRELQDPEHSFLPIVVRVFL